MKYKKGNYMQEFVIEVVQGSDPVKIPTKFFEHDKNAGTWSENTAMILRSFERSEYCAPIEDYYLQMQQFDQTIKLESVDCASFFFKVIKVVMDQAVARRYDGPLPQAMTCKNKQMVTSAMVVMRRIQNARLRILRKNGEKLLETGIFEKIGLTYGFQSKLLAPNVISFQLSKDPLQSSFAGLGCAAKPKEQNKSGKNRSFEKKMSRALSNIVKNMALLKLTKIS